MGNKNAGNPKEGKIVDYINKEFKKGFKLKDIKKQLLKYGYSKESVSRAIQEVEIGIPKKPIAPGNFLKYSMISLLVIIIIVVAWFGLNYIKPTTEPAKIPTEVKEIKPDPIELITISLTECKGEQSKHSLHKAKRSHKGCTDRN